VPSLLIPDFGGSRDQAMTDFNDMASSRGVLAVKSAIAGARNGSEYETLQKPTERRLGWLGKPAAAFC
jgi:hypothetical protein